MPGHSHRPERGLLSVCFVLCGCLPPSQGREENESELGDFAIGAIKSPKYSDGGGELDGGPSAVSFAGGPRKEYVLILLFLALSKFSMSQKHIDNSSKISLHKKTNVGSRSCKK